MQITKTLARSLAASALASATCLVGGEAFAQTEPPTESATDSADSGLGEIVVTAQKRSENVQKVPATIAAFGSETLDTRQIDSIAGLQSEVPSLVVGEYYGTSLITLRGISTGLTSGAEDPSVATHINGVYQPRSRSVDSAMVDLERIEVLSGPQGTLYGRNATGGVVNYILKRPGRTFGGEVTARAGNYSRYGVQGRASGPLSDGVRLLVSGIYDNQDKGFTKNLLPGAPQKRMESNRVAGGRAALDIDLSDRIGVQLDSIYLDTRTTPVASAFGPSRDPALQAFLGTQSFRPHEVYSELKGRTHSKYFQNAATVNLDISDDVSLKSITGYQTFRDNMLIDLDASPAASVPIDQRIKSNTFSQEFDLSADLMDGKLKSIFGAFYYDDHYLGVSSTAFNIPGFAANFDTYSKIGAKTYAAFTDHTFSVTDRFRLQGGIRFNRDEKTATQSVSVGGFALCPLVTNSRHWEAWTPRFGAQYDITDDAMVYGQWSRGFKAGGFTSNSCADDYDPEKIKGPEVGIKTKLFDNRVRFNLAGYYYKISDLQVQQAVDVGTFLVQNAAAAKIYGAEFSLVAAVADNLELDASGMVQSAKYTSFLNCDESAFVGACGAFDPRSISARLSDVSGNWLNRAAPYSLNLGLQYTFETPGGGELLVRGESFFSGRVHFREFDTAESTQSAYDTQNLFLTYTPENDRFVVRAFVKNIGDTDYKTSYFYQSSIQEGNGNWARPRTYGIEGTVRF